MCSIPHRTYALHQFPFPCHFGDMLSKWRNWLDIFFVLSSIDKLLFFTDQWTNRHRKAVPWYLIHVWIFPKAGTILRQNDWSGAQELGCCRLFFNACNNLALPSLCWKDMAMPVHLSICLLRHLHQHRIYLLHSPVIVLHEISSHTGTCFEYGASAKALASFVRSPVAVEIHINRKEYALSTMTTMRIRYFGKLVINYLLLITVGALVFLIEWFLFKYTMSYAICCSRLFELSSIWFWATKWWGEHTDGLSHKEVWWHVITLRLFFFFFFLFFLGLADRKSVV